MATVLVGDIYEFKLGLVIYGLECMHNADGPSYWPGNSHLIVLYFSQYQVTNLQNRNHFVHTFCTEFVAFFRVLRWIV